MANFSRKRLTKYLRFDKKKFSAFS